MTVLLVTVGLIFLILTFTVIGIGNLLLNGDPDEVRKYSFWKTFGFTDDTPNLIQAVVAGDKQRGRILRYIMNKPGKKYDQELGVVPLLPGEDPYDGESDFLRFIREKFGKRYLGWPFFYTTQPLSIDRVVNAPTMNGKIPLENQLLTKVVSKEGLYQEFFRPTLHAVLDTNDAVRFGVISYANVEVFDATPAFTVYRDNFLQNISEIISSFIAARALEMDWNTYKTTGKEITPEDLGKINKKLNPLGVRITQLSLGDPEPDPEIQKALSAKKIAEEKALAAEVEGEGKGNAAKKEALGKAEARRTEADAEKYATTVTGEGDAVRIKLIAEANASRIAVLADEFIKAGYSPVAAGREAKRTLLAELESEAIGKLTGTYVAGGKGKKPSLVITSTKG